MAKHAHPGPDAFPLLTRQPAADRSNPILSRPSTRPHAAHVAPRREIEPGVFLGPSYGPDGKGDIHLDLADYGRT